MRKFVATAALCALAACSGSPIGGDGGGDGGSGGGTGGDTTTTIGGIETPKGTASPTANGSITRYDDTDGATSVTYDEANDRLTVSNLPFDANGRYDRDDAVPSVNGFSVYENNNTTERRAYKAIFGQSTYGRVAIVRTGDYVGYGFGGFMYARDLGGALPRSGQATYNGNYAGIRVYDGIGGLNYTRGDVEMIVDFTDFEDTRAVEGVVYNRAYFDQAGNQLGTLPVLVFATGSISDAGEIAGEAASTKFNPSSGDVEDYESGTYYAVLAGPNHEEIVGVVVVEAAEDGYDAKETGAFLLDKTHETP